MYGSGICGLLLFAVVPFWCRRISITFLYLSRIIFNRKINNVFEQINVFIQHYLLTLFFEHDIFVKIIFYYSVSAREFLHK